MTMLKIIEPDCKVCSRAHLERIHSMGNRDNPPIMIIWSQPPSAVHYNKNWLSGNQGKIITSLLLHCNIDPADVYFTSVLQCRSSKTVTNGDLLACGGRLASEIAEIKPKTILSFSETWVLQNCKEVTRSKGGKLKTSFKFARHIGTNIPVIYSPSPDAIANPKFASPDYVKELMRNLECAILKCASYDPIPFIEAGKVPYTKYKSGEALIRRLKEIPDGAEIAVDIETTSLDPHEGSIKLIGISDNADSAFMFEPLDCMDALPEFIALLNRCKVTCHNSLFEGYWFKHYLNHNLQCSDDTLLLHYLQDERRGMQGLKLLGQLYFNAPNWDEKVLHTPGDYTVSTELEEYLAMDCVVTFRLREKLRSFESSYDQDCYENLIKPISYALIKATSRGIRINMDELDKLEQSIDSRLKELNEELAKLTGFETNVGSKKFKDYLFGTLQLPILKVSAKTDNPSADNEVLDTLADMYPHVKELQLAQEIRRLNKISETYVTGLRKQMYNGRVHPKFSLHGTETGRLSSNSPNIQQIPRDGDIKRVFIPDDGFMLFEIDYSQIEFRVAAHLSQDPVMLEYVREGRDIHTDIASKFFKITPENVTKAQRNFCKTIVYGNMYGLTPQGAAARTGSTVEEAIRLQNYLKTMFPRYYEWENDVYTLATERGYSLSQSGRRRRFPLILSESIQRYRRQVINSEIQGFASDINLYSCIEIDRTLVGDEFHILAPIHDSILGQSKSIDLVHRAGAIMKTCPAIYYKLDIPLDVEIKVGPSWKEMEKIK